MVTIRAEIRKKKKRKINKNNFRHFETYFQMVSIFVYFSLMLKKMSYLVLQTSKFLTKSVIYIYIFCFSSLFNAPCPVPYQKFSSFLFISVLTTICQSPPRSPSPNIFCLGFSGFLGSLIYFSLI